jgi:hypothetical protein
VLHRSSSEETEGIMSKTKLFSNVMSALAVAGCLASPQALAQASTSQEGLHAVVRAKSDAARGLRWELGWGAVFAYEEASGRFIRRISLADASFSGARGACRPALLLSRSGAVIVSSNIEPVLWRIDPVTFEVRRYDIVPDSDRSKDFGFSALAWDANEKVLYAASAMMGTLWRIDLDAATATKISWSPRIRGECAPAEQALASLR